MWLTLCLPYLESFPWLAANRRMWFRLLHKHARSSRIQPGCFLFSTPHLSLPSPLSVHQQYCSVLTPLHTLHGSSLPPVPMLSFVESLNDLVSYNNKTPQARFLVQFITSTWLSLWSLSMGGEAFFCTQKNGPVTTPLSFGIYSGNIWVPAVCWYWC